MINEYSIKDLERITGIKAHTIRIWEKRYNIVNPERSDTNIRHYCDDDLKRLLNISLLVKNGHKISKVAGLGEEELVQKVIELNNVPLANLNVQIESLILAMVDLDEERFEKVLNNCIFKLGFEDTLFKVIYPLLSKTGTLWQIGTITPAHEHFLSNLIRQKVYAAIDALPRNKDKASKNFLLVLPEWELHDIGLLVYNYLLRKRGYRTVFLGQGIPLENVAAVKRKTNPDIILTSFSTHVEQDRMLEYLNELDRHFDSKPVYVCGIQVANLDDNLPVNIHKVATSLDFKDEVLKSI